MRIAINGMGRIGRLLFRRLVNDPAFELVAINDIMDKENLLYLLKYDSVYGTFQQGIQLTANTLNIGSKEIVVLQQHDPSELEWEKLAVDIVLECSGKFTSRAAASAHLKAGAKKVMLSTTGAADVPLLIYGFNHGKLTAATDIVSPGGCMTNCSVPILDLFNTVGIESAQINILHSYTSRQELVDTSHKQFRRGRAAAESMIPVEIDLADSLEKLLGFKNNIAALSVRIPVSNGALADFTVQLKKEITKDEINQLFLRAAEHEYKGIIQYTEDPLVSADIKGNTHSSIIDGSLTSVAGRQVKIMAWFDNEYGYTSRMIDWLRSWKKLL